MYGMVRDPVCIMMIDEKTVQHISEVDGQKVHLCSAYCKNQLHYNPHKYGYWNYTSSFSSCHYIDV